MPISQSADEGPEFGYGKGRRPLWNARDRDAEQIRRLLRRAGCKEFGQKHRNGDRGGFVVEGGGKPFHVACAMYTQDHSKVVREIARYWQTLTTAGCRIEPDPQGDSAVWEVWLPSEPVSHATRTILVRRLLGRR